MLNYAYAVLESQLRITIVSQGLDPTIGYLHACRPRRMALVYDLMEPLRSRVDHLVLGFVHSNTFSPNDFTINTNGVCRLHPEVARQLVRLSVSDKVTLEMVAWFVEQLRTR